jgi:hypothetical protein
MGIVHPRLASRFEEQSMAPSMPDSAMTEPESTHVPGPAAPARTGTARPERPAGIESRVSPKVRRAPSTRQGPDRKAADFGPAGIGHHGKFAPETGSAPGLARTVAEPDSDPPRSRDPYPERAQRVAGPTPDPGAGIPQPSGRTRVDDTRTRRSRARGKSAAPDAPDRTAAAPAAPQRAEPAAPESPRQPEPPAKGFRIGERSEERPPPGVLQAPDWTAELQHALRDRHGEPQPPASSEPTVNVTIGRIDIRAVRREHREPAPRAAAQRSIMSLDDYLAKRNGRRR